MRLTFSLMAREHYRLVVLGGGAAGCAISSKFARILPRHQKIAVVEPQLKHYYQPGLTLYAAGLMPLQSLVRHEHSVLPRGVDWLQSGVAELSPAQNQLNLADGSTVSYDFLVIATGIELRFDLIEGLPKNQISVLELPGICSIYFPEGASKARAQFAAFQAGQTALFTHPNAPIKCAGAPQKICYLAEEQFRRQKVRQGSRVIYCTSLPRVYGVPKYADALMAVVKRRGIELNTLVNLCKVDPNRRVATFQVLDENSKPTGEHREIQYDLLHIGPPCSPVAPLREHAKAHESDDQRSQLTDAQGFVRVDPRTLQSLAHKNVFALGDCANTPNAKTAAALSSQLRALNKNLHAVMQKQEPSAEYDGYTSCPLLVDRNHVILAEFNSQGPLETFPYDQAKPTRFAFWLKRYGMPSLYWLLMLRGYWEGPTTLRKLFHPINTIREKLALKRKHQP